MIAEQQLIFRRIPSLSASSFSTRKQLHEMGEGE